MTIDGANLGSQEVEFDRLTNYGWTKDEELKRLISYIEKIYYTMLQREEDILVKPFPVDENKKAIIRKGMINHRCTNNLESLSFISKHGVIASEWFGILESEREGCFCSFISRMKGEDYPYRGDLAEDDRSRLNIGNNIILFFDESNPVMQYLLHLDYFEYEHQKSINKENISTLYTKEEIELFDKLIEPISPAGKGMRKDYDFKTNYWSAIPGGIPSFLINGICIKNNKMSEEMIEEISKMFPNATIFNANLEVVHYPYCDTMNNQTKNR